MSIKTIGSISIEALKELTNSVKILVKESKKGNLYGTNEANDQVCSFAKDIDLAKPMVALTQLDEETGDQWHFVINGEPAKVIAEI